MFTACNTGDALGYKSPVPVYSDLFYLNGHAKAGSSFKLPSKPGCETAVYVIRGKVVLGDQTILPHELAILDVGEDLELKFSENAHIMIFGGEKFPEPRHIWWNLKVSPN